MSFRFVTGKVLAALATLAFVICFNFFLFRVVEGDPVANLFRGKNLTLEQRLEIRREFGLDGSKGEQFVRYLEQTAQLNFGRSYTTNRPVMSDIWERAWPTIALVGDLEPPVGGIRRPHRDRRCVARDARRSTTAGRVSPWRRTRCPTSGSGCSSS